MASTRIGGQALVIGAGMAGLTAASALAHRFEHVVVLERDSLPAQPAHRAGTPQARHVHGLLISGQRALSELFPGSSRIWRAPEPSRSGRASMFASNARVTILSRNAPRLVRLRGVTAGDRARPATAGRGPSQYHAAPALPGQGSVGLAGWRAGHRCAL